MVAPHPIYPKEPHMSMRELIRDFLGRPARDDLQPYLQVLDCCDLMDLAGMYGEARERGDIKLMEAINDRMAQIIKQQGSRFTAPSTKEQA